MSKLIDVDAVIAAIKKDRANAEGKLSLSVVRDIAVVMDQPDAAEPLRKRIAELEGLMELLRTERREERLLKKSLWAITGPDSDTHEKCWARYVAARDAINVLLKGGQDA